jgi:hypothetical protein
MTTPAAVRTTRITPTTMPAITEAELLSGAVFSIGGGVAMMTAQQVSIMDNTTIQTNSRL